VIKFGFVGVVVCVLLMFVLVAIVCFVGIIAKQTVVSLNVSSGPVHTVLALADLSLLASVVQLEARF